MKPKAESNKIFTVDFSVRVKIELSPALLGAVDKDWKKTFYKFETKEQIAAHVARCLLKGWTLKSMDGFADLPEDAAAIVEEHWDIE